MKYAPSGVRRRAGCLSGVVALVVCSHLVSAQETGVTAADIERGRASARAALEAADRNGDGKISPDEAVGPARLFPRADEDGDGFLTLPEFEAPMVPPEDAVASALGPQRDDETLLRRLQSGGLVIIFRHGGTNPDQTDQVRPAATLAMSPAERQSAFMDCARQRTLSDEGREELRRVAAAIHTIGFVVDDVRTSPMCRTRETAWLVFGQVTPDLAMVLPQARAERRRLAGTVPPDGTNQVIVTHSAVVAGLVWYSNNPANPAENGLPEGHAFVVEPLGESRYRFLASVGPEDWERLAGTVR